MKTVNSDLAYDYIRKRILAGEYRPGMSLLAKVLAEEIGVSRTPVREALHQLEVEGLVNIQPRLGASVKRMDIKEYRELCGLRLALETYAAGLAAENRTESDLREIGYALEAMRSLVERLAREKKPGLVHELMREDVRFHIAIMTAAKNDLVKSEFIRLQVINRVVTGPIPREEPSDDGAKDRLRREVLACHEEIYRAIESRDRAAAKASMERHIQETIDDRLRLVVHNDSAIVPSEPSASDLMLML